MAYECTTAAVPTVSTSITLPSPKPPGQSWPWYLVTNLGATTVWLTDYLAVPAVVGGDECHPIRPGETWTLPGGRSSAVRVIAETSASSVQIEGVRDR